MTEAEKDAFIVQLRGEILELWQTPEGKLFFRKER